MPRRPRLHLDGFPLHIVQRGHNRAPSFLAPEDYHSDTYLLACQCYIERNPVRAGMVADPGDYFWNSYRHYAHGAPNPYLTDHALYLAIGADGPSRQAAYRRLHEGPENSATLSEIRLAINQNQPLGNDRFHAQIEAMTGQRREARPRGRPRRLPAGDLGPDGEQLDLPL